MALVLGASVLGGIGMATTPAMAQYSRECLDGCDEDFPPNDIYLAAARGWCYILRCTIE
ncbi:MAG TPA: hypothetical protein VF188_12540 [Longimicrobiales bacterium]